MPMALELYKSIMELSTMFIIILLQRWLLGLSTIEKDLRWLKNTAFYRFFYHIQWYRGIELYYQYQARKIIESL